MLSFEELAMRCRSAADNKKKTEKLDDLIARREGEAMFAS